MSMNFDNPIDAEQQAFIKEMFGKDVAAMDDKTVLVNRRQFLQTEMKAVANKTGQPVSLEINDEGEIKTLSDGSRYRVTKDGWEKL